MILSLSGRCLQNYFFRTTILGGGVWEFILVTYKTTVDFVRLIRHYNNIVEPLWHYNVLVKNAMSQIYLWVWTSNTESELDISSFLARWDSVAGESNSNLKSEFRASYQTVGLTLSLSELPNKNFTLEAFWNQYLYICIKLS